MLSRGGGGGIMPPTHLSTKKCTSLSQNGCLPRGMGQKGVILHLSVPRKILGKVTMNHPPPPSVAVLKGHTFLWLAEGGGGGASWPAATGVRLSNTPCFLFVR